MQMGVDFVLTGAGGAAIPPPMLGDGLQGVLNSIPGSPTIKILLHIL